MRTSRVEPLVSSVLKKCLTAWLRSQVTTAPPCPAPVCRSDTLPPDGTEVRSGADIEHPRRKTGRWAPSKLDSQTRTVVRAPMVAENGGIGPLTLSGAPVTTPCSSHSPRVLSLQRHAIGTSAFDVPARKPEPVQPFGWPGGTTHLRRGRGCWCSQSAPESWSIPGPRYR